MKSRNKFENEYIEKSSEFELELKAAVTFVLGVDELELESVGSGGGEAGDKVRKCVFNGVSVVEAFGELSGLLVQELAIELHGQLHSFKSDGSFGSSSLQL